MPIRRFQRPGFRFPVMLAVMAASAVAFGCRSADHHHDHDHGHHHDMNGAEAASPASTRSPGAYAYPEAPRSDQVDIYHGVSVTDPFRPLENPDAPETRRWIEAENEITHAYLEAIPQREAIKQRLTELWDFEKFGLPVQRDDRYFYTRNDGLQNHAVLYTQRGIHGTPQVVLDPNEFSDDGSVALAGWEPSENGKLMAYATSDSGSDWREWFVQTVQTGLKHSDHLKWVKFSGAAWTHDNRGFFYSRYDEPKEGAEHEAVNYYQKLYYHRIDSPQSVDILTYERPDKKKWGFGSEVTDNGAYLIINVWRGTERKNLVFYKNLQRRDAEITEVISEFDAQFDFIDSYGTIFWFRTDYEAPRGRVIAINIDQPERENWTEVIPETKDILRSVNVVSNRFVATYLRDAASSVKVHEIDGSFSHEVDLPGIGTARGFGGERKSYRTFYSYTSFTDPPTIYSYNVAADTSEVFRRPDVDVVPNDYVTKQVFYESKDGTRVPMFLTHKKGLKIDGDTPTLLYAYGGFNIPITPSFSITRMVWMEMGGIYAVANIRGGGEYGREWHQAGTKLNKQNVFDDFIAAAEWLVDNNYTNPDKLAMMGGSNGGLLVGACMAQRPDLFAAAVPAVGVMDMLRFPEFTIGWAWVSDFGSPDDPEEFKALYAYSPLHNLEDGAAYPATLITTADHDDRVVPAHSFKFAARLQEAHAGTDPVLIRIQTKAGHGAGKPTSMRIQESADILAFLARELGMELDW